METILHLTPLQTFFALAVNLWMFIIFPLIVIRKINHITEILESQLESDQPEDSN